MACFFLAGWWWLLNHTALSPTDSLRHRLFFKKAAVAGKTYQQGDYVTFDVEHPLEKGKVISIIKRVACIEGDTLTIRDREYYCNGKYLGLAKEKNIKGQPTNPWKEEGQIGKGWAFVIGDSPDSYDSRYYGPISLDRIKEQLWAIW